MVSQVAELVDALTPCDNFRNEKRFTGSNPVLTTFKKKDSTIKLVVYRITIGVITNVCEM